jgi:acyl dehydratase
VSLAAGNTLPSLDSVIEQEDIAAYAEASGDFNPLHLDPSFATTTQFGGTIVHGMHQFALLNQLLTAAFGEQWPANGRLKVRFRAPARPGDRLTASATVIKVEDGQVTLAVELTNQAADVLISGDARVTI